MKIWKIKKLINCTKKVGKSCLIWSVFVKMDKWLDVTVFSWHKLQLEIKHYKVMLSHLKASKISDLVHRQRLHHCMEELCILEWRKSIGWWWLLYGKAAWDHALGETTPGVKVHQVNQLAHPLTRSLQDPQQAKVVPLFLSLIGPTFTL